MRPEIEGPEDVTVVPGEATEFTVVIHAYPEPQVIWSKDHRPIDASDLISIVEDRANDTYKLVFHKVMLADEGYYKVTASNKLGESSSEARLKTLSKYLIKHHIFIFVIFRHLYRFMFNFYCHFRGNGTNE